MLLKVLSTSSHLSLRYLIFNFHPAYITCLYDLDQRTLAYRFTITN